jgi:transposase
MFLIMSHNHNCNLLSDLYKAYDGFAGFGYKHHYGMKHSDNEFINGYNHVNGIDNF